MAARLRRTGPVSYGSNVGSHDPGVRRVDRLHWLRCSQSEASIFAALLVLVLVAKAPVLATPFYWDETLWISFAHHLAVRPLWQVFPGLHERFLFGNRLPGLFLPMAAVFKVTGPSIVVAHALAAAFAFVGVYFTYRLASLLFGRVAGVLAALFLLFNATYFAQSAMFLADLPAAALAVTAVYFAVRRRFPLYWASSLYLVFLKEPVVAVPCALAAWAFVVRVRTSPRDAVLDAARYAAPVPVIAGYYVWQWYATGEAFVHYDYPFDPFASDLAAVLAQLPRVHGWLLVEQGRWVFAVLVLAAFGRRDFRRREVLLLVLLVCAAGYSYALLYFLPRYLLPTAPFLAVLAAGAVVTLLPDRRFQLAAGALLVVWLLTRLEPRVPFGNREMDMGYLRVVAMHREACRFVERELPGRSVRAGFPLSASLSRPELGYVERRVAVLPGLRNASGPADLVVAGFPGAIDPLEADAERRGLERLRRFGEDDARVTVYAGAGAQQR